MPWIKVTPMEQKLQFIRDTQRGIHSMTDLCELFNISRKTGYKYLKRFMEYGFFGLADRTSRPNTIVRKTSQNVIDAIILVRQKHPFWGARKILKWLGKQQPTLNLPHCSTVCDILNREGMVRRKKKRRKVGHPGKPHNNVLGPNDLWCADFKGQFKMKNGEYCYTLTVTDSYSRTLLVCKGLRSTSVKAVKKAFLKAFKKYGLPKRIRTDNGVPFATVGLARLSALSVWWIRLGIIPELIEPGCPQQNGRHERMHKTLKEETTNPPATNLRKQQAKFDRFLEEYNNERPHEALDMETPSSCYTLSPRKMPAKIPVLEYPDRFELRYVSANGGIRWNNCWVNVTQACKGEYVGLEEHDEGIWNVYFGPKLIGRFIEKIMKIEDEYARVRRKKVLPTSPD